MPVKDGKVPKKLPKRNVMSSKHHAWKYVLKCLKKTLEWPGSHHLDITMMMQARSLYWNRKLLMVRLHPECGVSLWEPCLKENNSNWNWHRGARTGWVKVRDYEMRGWLKKTPQTCFAYKKEYFKCQGEKIAKRY